MADEQGEAATEYTEAELITNIRKGQEDTVAGILYIGEWLVKARAQSPYKDLRAAQWNAWLRAKVSMTKGEASKFMTIWSNPVIRVSSLKLPPRYPTLYSLARIPADQLAELIATEQITPATTGSEAEVFRTGTARAKPDRAARKKLEEAQAQVETLTAERDDLRRQLDNAREFQDVISPTAVLAPGQEYGEARPDEWDCSGCHDKFPLHGSWRQWCDWESLPPGIPFFVCGGCVDLLEKAWDAVEAAQDTPVEQALSAALAGWGYE